MQSAEQRGAGIGRAFWRAAVVALSFALFSPASATDRLIDGGYGRDSVAMVDPSMLGPVASGLALAGAGARDDGLALGVDDQGAFLSYFTPRHGGLRVGLGRTGLTTPGGEVEGAGQIGLGVSYLHRFGGFELGLAGGGGLELVPLGAASHGAETRASFVVGGVLRMPDLGYGPMSARLTYGIESQPARSPVSELSLGADLLLWPGIAVTGEVARAEEQDGASSASTRGRFGLRLRF
jgi:hypothetical protein